MTQEIRTTYLCLLDNLNLKDDVTLGEFSVRNYDANRLSSLLQGRDDCDITKECRQRMEFYANFPWASLEKRVNYSKDSMKSRLQRIQLSWAHAGKLSWFPFEELVRTLNLLKVSVGPIIARQFYHRPFPYIQTSEQIKRIIYSEPYQMDLVILREYDLGTEDLSCFDDLRKQLKKCLKNDSPNNSYLKIAIHHFENADRRLTPKPLSGSFNAIDPLMSYEASLEALLILEKDRGGFEEKLSTRVSSIIPDNSNEIQNFIRRVFRLRSKFAHGAWAVSEIEKYVVNCPNKGISEKNREDIQSGNYRNLLLKGGTFPGFLVNLREVTRQCIRFFCKKYADGYDHDKIINQLDEKGKKK